MRVRVRESARARDCRGVRAAPDKYRDEPRLTLRAEAGDAVSLIYWWFYRHSRRQRKCRCRAMASTQGRIAVQRERSIGGAARSAGE